MTTTTIDATDRTGKITIGGHPITRAAEETAVEAVPEIGTAIVTETEIASETASGIVIVMGMTKTITIMIMIMIASITSGARKSQIIR